MRRDLVEGAEAARLAEARGASLPGLTPDEPQAQRVGVSGVPLVCYAQETAKPERAKPWKVGGGQGRQYVARVASPAEGAAVAEAWQHVGKIVGERADVKACRATARRMAADRLDGQAVLPLGDGLEGWMPRQGNGGEPGK